MRYPILMTCPDGYRSVVWAYDDVEAVQIARGVKYLSEGHRCTVALEHVAIGYRGQDPTQYKILHTIRGKTNV